VTQQETLNYILMKIDGMNIDMHQARGSFVGVCLCPDPWHTFRPLFGHGQRCCH